MKRCRSSVGEKSMVNRICAIIFLFSQSHLWVTKELNGFSFAVIEFDQHQIK